MIVLLAALAGLVLGVARARARRGSRLDMAHYGATHAIAFALLGLFATIALARLL